jgi:hypothetical protein
MRKTAEGREVDELLHMPNVTVWSNAQEARRDGWTNPSLPQTSKYALQLDSKKRRE